ncbi:MAG: Hsp20/alpha crystallin family protein [Candidatus Altiarchaeota archaeon]
MIYYGGESVDFQEKVRRMFEEAKIASQKPFSSEPLVYGLTLSFTKDGRPIFEEFGNVSPYGTSGFMEPVTDVIEKVDSVSVVAELPGVDKSDIDLRTSVESVLITVDRPLRKYIKDVRLSCRVKPETAVARYNNGVLEVVLKRADDNTAGRRVQVQ